MTIFHSSVRGVIRVHILSSVFLLSKDTRMYEISLKASEQTSVKREKVLFKFCTSPGEFVLLFFLLLVWLNSVGTRPVKHS